MSLFDLVTERDAQEEAADPTLSAFVTANAGSGKTKTLIDRVARLLLAKAKPETILCVTYTKAAASEMQRRLFQVLGGWSVASDTELRKALGLLRSRAPASFEAQDLSEARSLFAAALAIAQMQVRINALRTQNLQQEHRFQVQLASERKRHAEDLQRLAAEASANIIRINQAAAIASSIDLPAEPRD